MEQQRVNAHFASATAFWSEVYGRENGESHRYRLRLERALRWVETMHLPPGARALDVGAGAGFTTLALAEHGLVIDAIDTVQGMVELILERVSAHGMADRVNAQLGDIHALNAGPATYDLVLALGVVPWLHSPSRAMTEIARVLKPGGYVIATCANRAALSVVLEPMYNPLLEPVRRLVSGILRSTGLRKTPQHGPRPRMHSRHSFDRMLREAGLNKRAAETYGFGPMSFMNHRLPDQFGLAVDRRLQTIADMRVPVVRSAGVGTSAPNAASRLATVGSSMTF